MFLSRSLARITTSRGFHQCTAACVRRIPTVHQSQERVTRSDEDDFFGIQDKPTSQHDFLKPESENFDFKKFTDQVRGQAPSPRNILPPPSERLLGGFSDQQESEETGGDAEEDYDLKERPVQRKKENRSAPTIHQPGRTQGKYEFLPEKNQVLRMIMADVKNRENRKKSRKILLEGHRLINEALTSGVKVDNIFFSKTGLMDQLDQDSLKVMRPRVYEISSRQMAIWSDMTTPPGIFAVANIPSPEVMDGTDTIPLTVICDNIRDPTNMGAIVRVLAGVGCRQILLSKGCVDPWDSKVLRSSMGAHFHIPIHYDMPWELMNNHLDNPAEVFLAENLEPVDADPIVVRDDGRWPRFTKRRKESPLDIVPYYEVDFATAGSIVLVLGGEASGISEKAYALAEERRGKRVAIPLSRHIDSLNAASAVAVLSFEVRRQLDMMDGLKSTVVTTG